MRLLVVLSLLLVSRGVVANKSLSPLTKVYLKTGEIFKINLKFQNDKEWRMESLREINKSPSLLEEARNLVEAEHGAEKLPYLEYVLKYQEVADTLGTKPDMKIFTAAYLIKQMAMNSNFATKEDLENVYDEIINTVN